MSVFEERGVFWWHDEAIAEELLAPDAHVAGLLRVEDNGRAVLELDGYLSNPHGPMAAIAREPVTRCIQGLMKGSGDRVLLCDLIRNGGRFSTDGISYEKFSAAHCLIGRCTFPTGVDAPLFAMLTIPLTGFEDWLRLGVIKVGDAPGAITVSYNTRDDISYPDDDGILTLIFDIEADAAGMLGTHAYSLKQTAYAKLNLNEANTLKDIGLQFQMFEDLLKLLTGSDYELGWPFMDLPDGSRCRWHFLRMKNKEAIEAPSHYNTITTFPELRDRFGAIWSRWKAMRDEFGPGFYLYLGLRRGMAMYIEHRFVNLIWGLEAFHRKRRGGSTAVTAKVSRILDKIDDADDKRWLKKRLEHAHEPSLEQRLFEVFKALPLGLGEKKLRAFCAGCAKLRNDISHFGGERHDVSYSEFLKDANIKSEALSVLYHAVLLHEAGIDAQILKRWIFDSFLSAPTKIYLVQAGLLDNSVLRVEQQPNAQTPRVNASGDAVAVDDPAPPK
ncbi:HEPN domain-containing protein [Tardiphaga sp. 619_E2_N8_5]|uniref:ApeA N-terminal domain 1-containing protein n=1 Tax=unclassified Tardiphaga TaxID=2631404 RepID=UPI003F294466